VGPGAVLVREPWDATDGTIYVTDRAGSGLYILQPQVDFG
jgi:hypothetical protein